MTDPVLALEETEGGSGLQNMRWLLADRVVYLMTAFLISAAVARTLGPDRFGVFSFGTALTALMTAIATLGLDQIVVQRLVADTSEEEESVVVGTAIVLRILSAVAVAMVAVGVTALTGPDDDAAMVVVLVLVVPILLQALDPIEFRFQARHSAAVGAKARLVGMLAGSASRVGILVAGGGVVLIASSYLVDATLTALARSRAYGWVRLRRLRPALGMARSLLEQSWPLLLSGLSIGLYLRVDQVMLGGAVSEQELAVYAASTRLSEVLYFFPTTFGIVLAPTLMARVDDERFVSTMTAMFRGLAAFAVLVAIGALIFADVAVSVVYGAEYEGAATMLRIQCLSIVFVCLGVVQSLVNVARRDTRIALLAVASGAVVNIVLNLALIPAHGGKGSAFATLVAYATASTLAYVLSSRRRDVVWLQLRSVGAAVVHLPSSLTGLLDLLRGPDDRD